MRPDWADVRAVVLESDDWGLCAWSPDEDAFRRLARTPAFLSKVGQVYGRSTLESATDVRALTECLLEFRGADGRPPVWQANMVMAAPDYVRIARDGLGDGAVPILRFPEVPSRWSRPGLWEQVQASIAAGVWWPELHGLHHVPEWAWREALRRGDADARAAIELQSPVCEAVERSGEYDPSEPEDVRTRNLERAIAHFAERFGRLPASICPPDYRWNDRIEADVVRLGVHILQGAAERVGRWPRTRRLIHHWRWPDERRGRLLMPARISFEPRGNASPDSRLGPARARAAVRDAWRSGQPAVLSTHRVNYAHLDAAWSAAGRAALRDLLGGLCADGAVFLTDAGVRDLLRGGDRRG